MWWCRGRTHRKLHCAVVVAPKLPIFKHTQCAHSVEYVWKICRLEFAAVAAATTTAIHYTYVQQEVLNRKLFINIKTYTNSSNSTRVPT